MKALILRNILVFIKDKMAVLFSFLAVFVVYFLYLCFLKDAMLKELEPQFGAFAEQLCNRWVIAGTVGILTLTSSLSVLGILIADRSHQLLTDFQMTTLSPVKITFAYLISTTILTFFIALSALGIGEWYIHAHDGNILTGGSLFQVAVVLLIAIFACTSFLFCFLIWFKSTSSFSNITTIVGTLSGFLMGIYLPIGVLPNFLQQTIRYFPFSHGTALLRQIMMQDVLADCFLGQTQAREAFELHFGLYFEYGDICFPAWMSLILLFVVGSICSIIAVYFMNYILKHQV